MIMMALSQRSQGLGPAQLKGPNLQSSQVGTKLEFVWKHKSCLDPQIKITARLILL